MINLHYEIRICQKIHNRVTMTVYAKCVVWFNVNKTLSLFRFKLTSHYKLQSLKGSCTISDNDSQGRLIDTDKWDNHNTIARGWAGSRAEDRIDLGGSEDHYQPVTFRKLYGTKSVAGPSTTPLPMSSKPVVSEQETYSPNDEGYADLWSFRILKKT